MPTFNNSTFFPVLLPVHPPPLTGFQDLMPYKSQFVYKIVLTFIFLHSLRLLWMCRSQGTHATKHLVNMPGRYAFQNHFHPFSQMGNLTHLTKPGSNVTSCLALPVPGSGPPTPSLLPPSFLCTSVTCILNVGNIVPKRQKLEKNYSFKV